MLSSEYQSHSIQIEDFKINPINPFNHFSTKGRVKMSNLLLGIFKILNLLLGMSYIMPQKWSSVFQSHSIKIEDFKINPINPFNPNKTKWGSEHFKPITKNVL